MLTATQSMLPQH